MGRVANVRKKGDFRLRRFKSNEVAGVLEPMLLRGVVVYVVRMRSDLLSLLRRLPVLLRSQRNRVGSYCGLEFDIAMEFGTGAVVTIAGPAESGLDTGLEMCFGLGLGMLGLLL